MIADDLKILLRCSKGGADDVAFRHIFNQAKLSEDDHAFLEEHLSALGFESLVAWLARGPVSGAPAPADDTGPSLLRRIIDRLAEIWPTERPEGQLMFWLKPRAHMIDPDAYDDLMERVRTRTEPRVWWWLARSLRGMCRTFQLATEAEHAPELVDALFPYRRDERTCRAEVLRLAREGGVVLRGPSWSLDSAGSEAPSPLRDRASVIWWMEQHDMLADLSPREVLPGDVTFPHEHDDRLHRADGSHEYVLRLALRWPGRDRADARDWFIDQVLRAARRGASWEGLLRDIVGWAKEGIFVKGREHPVAGEDARRLVEDIAWRSFEGDVVAPWIGYGVCRALLRRETDAWERAFRFLERRDLHFGRAQLQETFPWAHLIATIHGNDDELPCKHDPSPIPEWILLNAPLPDEPDDAFDERLLAIADAVPGEHRAYPLAWVHRLAELPLTRLRANRLLGRVLSSEACLQLADTEVLSKLADSADIPVEHLPAVEAFFAGRSTVEPARVAAYRKLGGGVAEEGLRRWMRAPLDRLDDERHDGPWDAAARMQSVPDLAPAGLLEDILERARSECLLDLVELQKAFPGLIPDALVMQVAAERVSDTSERWNYFDKVELPDRFADLALRRCRAPIGADELAALGRWLLRLGRDPHEILGCVLDRSPRLPWEWRIEPLVQDILSSRSRWETFGPAVFRAMLEDGAHGSLWSLVNGATSDRNGEVSPGIIVAIHEALAVALLGRAAAALQGSDEERAIPALHALIALHPPARLSAKLLPLIARTTDGGEARDLVQLNLRLLKRSKTRDAQASDVLGALQLLAEPRAA